MCGRYELKLAGQDPALEKLLSEGGFPLELPRGREIRPGDLAPTIVVEKGDIRVLQMRWGFEGPQGLVINARAETAAEKPMFRDSVRAFRCLLPASGYFEWHRTSGARYKISRDGEKAIYMAGLYQPNADGTPRFVVLTRAAVRSLEGIHPRMPLIFSGREERRLWLTDAEHTAALLRGGGTDALSANLDGPEQISMFEEIPTEES